MLKIVYKTALLGAVCAALGGVPVAVASSGEGATPAAHAWSFEGPGASWDAEQLFRGYKVATQVCLACHSFKYIKHRDLMKLGFSEAQVQALAKELEYTSIDQPFFSALTEEAAEQLYGGPVPDLSLMTLARHNGVNYVAALLTGYEAAPEGVKVPEGKHYNKYFPGHVIGMPAPLTAEGQVEYPQGATATVEQMATDVAAFLAWTAEPIKVERQTLGFYVLLYLAIFTLLSYGLMKHIWRDVKKS